MSATKLLRHFATTDGILRGTALASQVTCLATVALLQGFGTHAILFSSFLQVLATGILEVPTGWLSDRFGWARTLLMALCGKFIITLAMIAAVIAAATGHVTLAWGFVAIEALVDAVASSLLNGPYQNAYLEWYRENNNDAAAPPLFLASYRFAQTVRILLPMSIVGAVSVVRFASDSPGESTVVMSSLLGLTFVLLLRVIVVTRVFADLKKQIYNERATPLSGAAVLSAIRTHIARDVMQCRATLRATSNSFRLYFLSRLIYIAAALFLMGHVMRQSVVVFPMQGAGWSIATGFALCYYCVEVTASSLIFPRISSQNFGRVANALAVVVTLFGLLHCACVLMAATAAAVFGTLIIFVMGSLLIGTLIQRHITSNLDVDVPKNIRSTWLSVATSLAMLMYAAIAGIAMWCVAAEPGYLIIVGFVTIATGCVLMCTIRNPLKKTRQLSFHQVTRSHLLKVVFVGAVVFGAYDLFSFVDSTATIQHQFESQLGTLVLSSIREPLTQGSFTEASLRLAALKTEKTFVCSKLSVWDFSQDSCSEQSESGLFYREIQFPISLDAQRAAPIGALTIRFSHIQMFVAILQRVAIDCVLFGILGIIMFKISQRMGRKLELELDQVVQIAERKFTQSDHGPTLTTREFQRLSDTLSELLRCIEENTKKIALGEIAAQVAHDIRSPLTALKVVSGHLAELPEEKRVMIRNAVQRIDDIANDLAGKKAASVAEAAEHEAVSVQLLSSLIEPLISEKRIQFRARLGIEIQCPLDAQAYGAFARVQAVELKRVISNVVNNAVEAMKGDGSVTVTLSQTSETVHIFIDDTGHGIPEELLPKLMQRGATFGKATGSGLGLYHAKTTIEAWGGSLELSSTVGEGTTVSITLPRAEAPNWFVPALQLTPNSTIVVIDDDASIHNIWEERFATLALDQHDIHAQHFSSGTDAYVWYTQHAPAQSLFLCDYELLGDPDNGLDLIEKLGVQDRAILVTSRYEEPQVQARCAKMGVRLIPKGLAGYVPMQVVGTNLLSGPLTQPSPSGEREETTNSGYRVLLIDDDEGIRLAWELEREKLQIGVLSVFASFEECECAAPDYSSYDFAFVDKHIAHSSWALDQTIAELKSRGVKRVFVASGENAHALAADPLCAQADGVIAGKMPQSLAAPCAA